MIDAAVVAVAALALLVAFAVIATSGRRESADLSRFVAEKEAAWLRLRERERAVDAREAAMLERERELLQAHMEERRELLDRIQAPQMTAARLLPSGDGAEAEFEGDADIDLAFQNRPESVVEWDADLRPHPYDLTPSDDVAPPTTEPVRP